MLSHEHKHVCSTNSIRSNTQSHCSVHQFRLLVSLFEHHLFITKLILCSLDCTWQNSRSSALFASPELCSNCKAAVKFPFLDESKQWRERALEKTRAMKRTHTEMRYDSFPYRFLCLIAIHLMCRSR